jgi:hypothetical protein
MAAKLRCKCLLRQDLLRDPSNIEAVLQDRLIKDVIHRNMMPIDSLCLKHWEATFLSKKDLRLQGQLLVFLDWVVFVPNNAGKKKKELDIKISIRTLEFVHNHGDHLKLNVLTEPCEDLTEPSLLNVRTHNGAATQRCGFSKGLKFSNGFSNGLTV